MSDIHINNVLSQIRAMQAQASGAALRGEQIAPQAVQAPSESFSSVLKTGLDAVNKLQKNSGDLTTRFELGEPGVELVDVMIARQKSSVAFKAAAEVRNKLVAAYQDVMNMPV